MRLISLTLVFLLSLCFALAAWLQPRHAALEGAAVRQQSVLASLMGESRRLLAAQLYREADVYYHMGNYPSIFAAQTDAHDDHDDDAHDAMKAKAGLHQAHECKETMGEASDWLDRFSRNFSPSRHIHADQVGVQAEREVLPWLRLSAELDPQNPSTYTLAAYWLRYYLDRPGDAEALLREGLRANPDSSEILLELGRISFEVHKDPVRARHIMELALQRWDENQGREASPDFFPRQQILTQLITVTRQQQDQPAVKHFLQLLKAHSPNPAAVQAQIDELAKGSVPTIAK
jgi:tetratricopeptide (TPR) repeat protein